MSSGARWGDIILTAPRTSEEIAAEEAYVTELALSKESVKMRTYAQTQASVRRGKVMKPCKWLYLNEDGKTYSEHLTGAQCWAWEYVDPKTGKTQCPHTCKHLHPGEFGWRDEWEATETDKRALLRSLLPHTRVTFSTD
jgi:hypothetical protein